MHPEKVTVWCGLWAGGIIASYYFKNAANRNVTVNVERYRQKIFNFFLPKMQALDLQGMLFQWACGFNGNNGLIERRIRWTFISNSATDNWPPRSCDLTPLDYVLWGYVKAHIYTDKPASIDALADNIEVFIREIPAEMLQRVCHNWTKRMDHLKRSRRQHLHEISIQIKISCIFFNVCFLKNFPIAFKKSFFFITETCP